MFWLPLLAIAFIFPTCLEIPWDGLPFDHRGEFLALLFGALFALRSLLLVLQNQERSLRHGKLNRVEQGTSALICGFALLLLGLKLFAPVSQGIELRFRDPFRDSTFRYTSERFIHRVDYGGGHTPWRPGFQNTGIYNFISCPGNEINCLTQRKWKENLSLPFEASFSIPKNWLLHSDRLEMEYAGRIEVDIGKEKQKFFSQKPALLSLPLPSETKEVHLSYLNFNCATGFDCAPSQMASPLSLSQGTLRIQTQIPPHFLVFQKIAKVTVVILSLLLLTVIGCTLCQSWLDLKNSSFPLTQEWLVPWAIGAVFLCGMFSITFKRPLLDSQGEVLCSLLLGLILTLGDAAVNFRQRKPNVSTDLLFTLPGLFYLSLVALKLPHHDGFALMNDGDDWLSYASAGYVFLESPSWFTDPFYVFTKPLFVYFRAFLYQILGEGTSYVEILMRYLLALTPLLFLPAISKLLSQTPKRRWFFFVPVIGYTFFWCLKNLASYILIFWVSMGEIPQWLFGLLACASLFYASVNLMEKEAYTKAIRFACLFTFLSAVSRLQSLAVLILPWTVLISLSQKEARKILKLGVWCGGVTLAVIFIHAIPVFIKNWDTLVGYLGWTTQVKASESSSLLLLSFWKKVTFAPQVKVILLSLPVLGGLTLFLRRKSGTASPIWFFLAFAVSLLLHAFIRDAAYLPRHYVFLGS